MKKLLSSLVLIFHLNLFLVESGYSQPLAQLIKNAENLALLRLQDRINHRLSPSDICLVTYGFNEKTMREMRGLSEYRDGRIHLVLALANYIEYYYSPDRHNAVRGNYRAIKGDENNFFKNCLKRAKCKGE